MKETKFTFDSEATDLIDQLKESTKSSSRTELLRKALYLLSIVSEAHSNNKRIVIEDENGEIDKEIVPY